MLVETRGRLRRRFDAGSGRLLAAAEDSAAAEAAAPDYRGDILESAKGERKDPSLKPWQEAGSCRRNM